jgi:hypothetical protein
MPASAAVCRSAVRAATINLIFQDELLRKSGWIGKFSRAKQNVPDSI